MGDQLAAGPAADSAPLGATFTGVATQSWHARTPAEALATLHADAQGLAVAEVSRRLARVGPNVLPSPPRESAAALLGRQLRSPLVYVLLAAAALAAVVGVITDALVVLAVVALNTLVGFAQELRAAREIDALGQLVPETATARRDGRRASIAAEALVPGDVVVLEPGDKVPADLRLLDTRGLRLDESAITGESLPAEKGIDAVSADAALGDRRGMAFGGTLVVAGAGTGVVVATGACTELGRISSLLREAAPLDTPLTRQLAVVGRWLTLGILAAAAALLAVSVARGASALDAALLAITLAVGAIPEGLPAIVTIALAVGVRRMARRRAVIRHLPAVEALGSTTVICTDKTGTLTRNEMTVQALWTPVTGHYRVTGVGYEPAGGLVREGRRLASVPDDVHDLLLAGAVCNDAALRHDGGVWRLAGDPTEGALVVAAAKLDVDVEATRRLWPRVGVTPFDSERQYMATDNQAPGSRGRVVFLKGAPEVVVPRCIADAHGQPVRAGQVLRVVDDLAAEGKRVLAVARRPLPPGGGDVAAADAHGGEFTLLGLQAIIDPPRPEGIAAVRDCRAAGIMVKMITGDHLRTAEAVAREVGVLGAGERGVTGGDLDALPAGEFAAAVHRTTVFARVAPEHKLRIVEALQAGGHVVAMTGDGVNDAPALRRADVGVAMGITGTAVSRQAADVVLVDDNFASIAAAVQEGRRVYDNLVKALAFVLPTNLGQAVILVAAGAFFPVASGAVLLPMRATQLLWINLVATVALALPLALEAAEPDVMRRPPRRGRAPLFDRFVVWRTVVVSLLMAAGAVGVFLGALRMGGGAVAQAQTAAVTAVVLFQVLYVVQCRSLSRSARAVGLWTNPALYAGIVGLLALQGAFVYSPALQRLFGTAPPAPAALGLALAAALSVLPVVAAEKWVRRRRADIGNRAA